MKNDRTQKISVRLTEQSADRLHEAHQAGYTTSQFINSAVQNTTVVDVVASRNILPHILRIQSEMEMGTDPELQKRVRKELHGICQILKSCQSRM